MTVIYVDTLFLLNALVDYLLLLASARLAGEVLRRWRYLLGALLGGGYAVAIFLPGLEFLSRPPCRLAAAVLMVTAAFGRSSRLLRQTVIFFALACALGGGVLAIGLLGGPGLSLGAGVFYSGMDLKMVLLSAAGCYGVLTLVFQRAGKHTALSGELVEASLELGGCTVKLTALVDTGNTLSDPNSGRSVMVAEAERLAPLLPEPGRENLAQLLLDPATAMELLGRGDWRGRFRLLPYRAVGVDRGLLLCLRVDRALVGGRDRGRLLVGLSPTPVSDGGGYGALIGVE